MVEEKTSNEEIMAFLKDTVATKEDLEKFATKEDLERFATKEDLGKMQHEILDHVDDKFADFEGTTVTRQRKQDNKINRIIEVLDRFEVVPSE